VQKGSSVYKTLGMKLLWSLSGSCEVVLYGPEPKTTL